MSHNSKAIYQRYLGWYDGNPANLNPLPPEEAAGRYVDAMGGQASVLGKAKDAMGKGDYRWASELLSRLIFAFPDNREGNLLLADSLEQQGYQAESGSWRNAFLSAAKELRAGAPGGGIFDAAGNTFRNLPLDSILDMLAVRLEPNRALKSPMRFDLVFKGEDKSQNIEVRNGVLIHQPRTSLASAPTVLTVDRGSFIDAVLGRGVKDADLSAADSAMLTQFSGLFEAPRTGFGLVTARP